LPDIKLRQSFIKKSGNQGISVNQLKKILDKKKMKNKIELIQGDITVTIPAYIKKHPKLKIALLNLDTDIYEPAVTILENFYPKIVEGGILILDDYGVFKGETKAVDEYFKGSGIKIQKFPFSRTPSYIIKNKIFHNSNS